MRHEGQEYSLNFIHFAPAALHGFVKRTSPQVITSVVVVLNGKVSILFNRELMLKDVITRATLKEHAGAAALERGEEYFLSGAVGRLRVTEDKISADVHGTDTYKVTLREKNDELDWHCSCPRAADGYFCKHCVAVGLAWLAGTSSSKAKQGRKVQRDPWDAIREYLSAQSPASLIDLLLEAAERDERTYDALLLRAERTGGTARALAAYRSAIDRATGIAGFVDWREAGSFAGNIDQLVDSLEELLRPDSAAMLIDLTEYAIERSEQSLEQVDDSDGAVGDVVYRLGEMHHEACRLAQPDPVVLAGRLFRLQMTLPFGLCSFDALAYRDVLGESGLRHYRELAQAEWRKVKPRTGPGDYEPHRFRITHAMEQLARADNDIEQLVEIKAQDLSFAYRYFEIAEILTNAGQADKALEWAERGLRAYPARTDNRLRDFLATEYLKRQRNDEALQLTWIQFEEYPSLEQYRKLHDIAARIGVWPLQRQRALALVADIGAGASNSAARQVWQRMEAHSLRLEIALWEEDMEAAWDAANTGACSRPLLIRLAERLAPSRPDDAVALYRRVVPPIVEETSNRAYEQAIQLIRKIGGLMQKQNQNEQFRIYMADLHTRYKQKRNFIKLLNAVPAR